MVQLTVRKVGALTVAGVFLQLKDFRLEASEQERPAPAAPWPPERSANASSPSGFEPLPPGCVVA